MKPPELGFDAVLEDCVDAQAMAAKFPQMYSAPSAEDLAGLIEGDAIKVRRNNEHFWLRIIRIRGEHLLATLQGTPVGEGNEGLRRGMRCALRKAHICHVVRLQ
jgi:hypothetical protein